MRRITIFTEGEEAQAIVGVLEKNGYEYYAEEYAAPLLPRRQDVPPFRRVRPDVSDHEPGAGVLKPTKPAPPVPAKKVEKKIGRPVSKARTWITQVLRDTGQEDYDGIMKLAKAERIKLAQVRDTLRRMKDAGVVSMSDGVYRLEKKDAVSQG